MRNYNVAPPCSIPSLLFARVIVCIQETQWPSDVRIAWFMGKQTSSDGNVSCALHGKVFPPSLACKGCDTEKHANLWKAMWKVLGVLKSHERLGVLYLLLFKKKKKCGGGERSMKEHWVELHITLCSRNGNLHVYWCFWNNERLKNSEILSLMSVLLTF
jgi:hypothetical protein